MHLVRHFASYLLLTCCALSAYSPSQATAQGTRYVSIESTPPGATVFLDTTDTAPLGITPLRNVRVSRGNHVLIVRKEGHEETRLAVEVRRSRETFRVVLNALATFVISAGNAEAQGAGVRVDGESAGTIPTRIERPAGRYLVEVNREGHQPFQQWLTASAGQLLTLPVSLQSVTPQTGSILVAPDVTGAIVFVDGEPRGTTPVVVDDVAEGEHRVEIRTEGGQPHTQVVLVRAGQRARVTPTLTVAAAPVTGGTVRVLTNVDGATVRVDGEVVGPAPATRSDLRAGEHIVEAMAEGYLDARQRVSVEDGQEHVISLDLVPEPTQSGRMVINANAAGATVLLDGQEQGPVPLVVREAGEGVYAVVVRAPGYSEFRTTCRVGPGVDCEINAELQPEGTPVRASSNAAGSEIFVDGERRGPMPWEGTITVGAHQIEVRAPGYLTHSEQVRLVAQEDVRVMEFTLSPDGELPEETRAREQREAQLRREDAVSHSAAPLPGDLTVLDMSLGWPYTAEVRFGVGVLDLFEGDGGLVAGFGIRSFGRLTEFEGRVHFGYRPLRQISVGAQLRIGGGLGAGRDATAAEIADRGDTAEKHPTNNFFTSLEALGSLHFSNAGAFTLWLGLDMYTDRWDWTAEDSDVLFHLSGEDDRQNQTRIRLGGALEVVLSPSWNVWGIFEGVILGPSESRRILGDVFGFGGVDTELYGRAGVTYRFGAPTTADDLAAEEARN
jgi:hypothetical protein